MDIWKKYLGAFNLVTILFLAACQEDEDAVQNTDKNGVLSVQLLLDQEVKVINARYETVSTDSFSLHIVRESGDTLRSFEYFMDVPEVLSIPVGNYYLVATNHTGITLGFDAPYYWGKSDLFTITPNQASAAAVTCVLANTMVTIKYSEHVKEYFDNYHTWVSVGGDSLYYDKNETRAGYLKGNPITVDAQLFSSVDADPVLVSGIIENPKEKHHYIITIDGYDDEGAINSIDLNVDESTDETNLTFSNVDLSHGLMAYYPLNGTADDISGNQFHGSVMGATNDTDRNGNSESAYYFDGMDDFITMGDVLDSVIAGDDETFSFSFWMKPELMDTKQIILAKSADTNCAADERQFHLKLTTEHTLEFAAVYQPGFHHNHRVVTSINSVSHSDKWSHIVLTYDGSIDDEDGLARVALYVDGKKETLELTSVQGALQSMSETSAQLALGNQINSSGQNCGTHNFKGGLDEVRIYNRVLSGYEVAALLHYDE